MKQAPNAALRAQRSKDSMHSSQHSSRHGGEGHQDRIGKPVTSDGMSVQQSDRPHSYVIDVVIMLLVSLCEMILMSQGNSTSNSSSAPSHTSISEGFYRAIYTVHSAQQHAFQREPKTVFASES